MTAKSYHLTQSNIPITITPFIGRQKEIVAIQNLLEDVRLVTLTGPGGIGKTRLAIEIAKSLSPRFEDGVKYVSLAAVLEPKHLATAIAQTLALFERSGKSYQRRLEDYFKHKELLLVLDNFEQLIDAAPLLEHLLKRCSKLKILITSRVVIHLYDEYVFIVPPLELPKILSWKEAQNSEAISLFLERAKAVKPHFEITEHNIESITKTCFYLNGLPLAIELAASRLRILSPGELLNRLKAQMSLLMGTKAKSGSTHLTLRHTIAWSYQLLPEEERAVLRKLAVFRGGFTLEGMEVVTLDESNRIESVNILEALVEKSLVYQEEDQDNTIRFYLLEVIRAFSFECLANEGDIYAIQYRHALYYMELAEKSEPELKGSDQSKWLSTLQAESDNFQAAMDWILWEEKAEVGLRLGGALWRFWFIRLYRTEGLEWLNKILNLPSAIGKTKARAKALEGLGLLHSQLSNPEEGLAYLGESIALWQELGNTLQVAILLNHISWFSFRFSEYQKAMQYALEARDMHIQIKNTRGIALAYGNLSWISMLKGDFSIAKNNLQKAKVLHLEVGDQRNFYYNIIKEAWVELLTGNVKMAEQLLVEAISYLEQLGEGQLTAFGKHILGRVYFAQMSYTKAYQLIEESEALFKKTGDSIFKALIFCTKAKMAVELGKIVEAELLINQSLAIFNLYGEQINRISETYTTKGAIEWAKGNHATSFSWFKKALQHNFLRQEKYFMLENIEWIAKYAVEQQKHKTAVVLLGFCNRLREELSTPQLLHELAGHKKIWKNLESQLNSIALEKNRKTGHQMKLNQAVNLALSLNDLSQVKEAKALDFFKQLHNTIEAHLADERFNTDMLCRLLAISRTKLHHKIKALTNQSTASYIRSIRLQKAKSLLQTTDLPIAEVAAQVGFKDASHFSKSYFKVFGQTPSETRK